MLIDSASSPGLSPQKADEIPTSLAFNLNPLIILIWGAYVGDELEGEVWVFVHMKGVGFKNQYFSSD